MLAEHDDADLGPGLVELDGHPDPLVGLRRWHADVGHHDVGLRLLDERAQPVEVLRCADELQVRGAGEDPADAFPDQDAVLSVDDPDHSTGRTAVSLVPRSPGLQTVKVPPRSAARPRSPRSPEPSVSLAPPIPLSLASTSTWPPSVATPTRIDDARECFCAFASASATM